MTIPQKRSRSPVILLTPPGKRLKGEAWFKLFSKSAHLRNSSALLFGFCILEFHLIGWTRPSSARLPTTTL